MAKKDIWVPLYINDYLGDTMHLTTEQHGMYFLLLMAYYRNRGPLPDDHSRLAVIAGLPPKTFKANLPLLQEFFEIKDGKWFHARSDKEIADANVRKDKAKKAAEARHEREKNKCS